MRQVTHTVYQFDELTEEAQQRAISEHYDWNIHNDWYDFVYDDAKRAASALGISISNIYFSGFASQGDGACFEGSYEYKKGSIAAAADYGKELQDIARALLDAQRPAFYGLVASAQQRGFYSHSGCMAIDVERYNGYYDRLDVSADQHDAIEQALRDFADWIYARLEAEYDYLTSEEAIAESLRANEMEFHETGAIA